VSKKNGQREKPPIPEALQELLDRAKGQQAPRANKQDQEALGTLRELLMPIKIEDPNHRGEGTPKLVWREPLLMISFDRSMGAFKVALGDKLFKLTTSCLSESLGEALVALETAIKNRTAVVRERD